MTSKGELRVVHSTHPHAHTHPCIHAYVHAHMCMAACVLCTAAWASARLMQRLLRSLGGEPLGSMLLLKQTPSPPKEPCSLWKAQLGLA